MLKRIQNGISDSLDFVLGRDEAYVDRLVAEDSRKKFEELDILIKLQGALALTLAENDTTLPEADVIDLATRNEELDYNFPMPSECEPVGEIA